MNCSDCTKNTAQEKPETQEPIMYIVALESAMIRSERKEIWLIRTIIFLISLLVITNLAWLHYESQFEDISQEVIQEATENGTNNFIGGDVNGKADYSND